MPCKVWLLCNTSKNPLYSFVYRVCHTKPNVLLITKNSNESKLSSNSKFWPGWLEWQLPLLHLWRCIYVLKIGLVHAELLHFALMEVLHLWRCGPMLKDRTFVGTWKPVAHMEVLQLWRLHLWRVDCILYTRTQTDGHIQTDPKKISLCPILAVPPTVSGRLTQSATGSGD